MICNGIDVASGNPLEIGFNGSIVSVAAAGARSDTYIAPGWIDIQVNGFAGVDYNDPEAPHEEIARSIQVQYATGVTRFYPTVITGSPENMEGSLRNLARARRNLKEGAAMDGFHVEGPHISPEDGPRGAHPQRWVRPPDVEEFKRWQDAAEGHIRLITVSP